MSVPRFKHNELKHGLIMRLETDYITNGASSGNSAGSLPQYPSDIRFEKKFTIALSKALAIKNDKPLEEYRADSFSSENRHLSVHPNYIDVLPCHAMRTERSPSLKDYLRATKILNKIEPRIRELSRLAFEEGPEGRLPLSNDSYDGLVCFLNKIAGLGLNLIPGLTLTYEGNLKAKWRVSPDERLALEFASPYLLKFLFFRPNPLSPDKTHRTSGSWSVEDFLDGHPGALEFLRDLEARSMFSRLYHSSKEKTSKTFRGAPATGFSGYHSGAAGHPQELVA